MQRIVVFDFDGTLYSKDSFAHFLIFLVRRSLWRSALTLTCVPLLMALRMGEGGIKRSASMLLWIATVGAEVTMLDAAMKKFVVSRSNTARFYQDALTCLRKHEAIGDRIIIASGCAQPLLGYLLASQQIEVGALGSVLKQQKGGFVCEWHCYGANKPITLARELNVHAIDVFYSDSNADVPLFAMAKENILVNASDRVARKVERRIGRPVIRAHWQ
jgi:phosphatidylglycerophosphatase C